MLFYFSGTGNTKWLCEGLCKRLEKQGIPAVALPIDKINYALVKGFVEAAGQIGIAFPVYFESIPQYMLDFIKLIPPSRGKNALVLCSEGAGCGLAARHGYVILKAKGYKVRWVEHIKMPDNITIKKFPFGSMPHGDEAAMRKKMDHAEQALDRLSAKMKAEKNQRRGSSPFRTPLGVISRFFATLYMGGRGLKLQIDPKRCTECGACEKECPSQCIALRDGAYTIGEECFSCLRCRSVCPALAIGVMGEFPEPGGWPQPYRGLPLGEMETQASELQAEDTEVPESHITEEEEAVSETEETLE